MSWDELGITYGVRSPPGRVELDYNISKVHDHLLNHPSLTSSGPVHTSPTAPP